MAETFQFDLVSPEKRLLSAAATQVEIPGAEGDITVMAKHSPMITTLRPGVLKVTHDKGEDSYVVTGGFAEISADAISVLAEKAIAQGDMSQVTFDAMVSDARAKHEQAKEVFKNEAGPVDDAAKLLSDMVAVGGRIGLEPKA